MVEEAAANAVDDQLTSRTFSLAMDIGMYLGCVVLRNVSGTKWKQFLRTSKFADYGQPVIVGFGSAPLNPVSIVVTNAYLAAVAADVLALGGRSTATPGRGQLVAHRKRDCKLRDTYDIWVKVLAG